MFRRRVSKKNDVGTDRGFTLVEVLIAMFIFTIGILAVATMQIAAMTGNSSADHATARVVNAQQKLEQLFALPFDDPLLEAAGNPPGTDSDGNTHQETTADGYTVRWDVTDNDPVANTKRQVL